MQAPPAVGSIIASPPPQPSPRIALAHDYLTQRGGAERVALALTRAFPGAPLHTSLYDPASTFPEFADVDVRPQPLNRLAPLRQRHRLALPLLAPSFAATRIDADVVICSSSGWAHGIRTRGTTIVYCHSPAKWLHRRDDYLGAHPSRPAELGLRAIDPLLRRFDRRAAARADVYLANSTFIAGQIRDVYGIEAEVVTPPPGLSPDGATAAVPGIEPGFMLSVARLLPYKNVPQTIDAFRAHPERRLVVVGAGPLADKLAVALPRNVRLVTDASDAQLRWLYANCAGLLAASREDLGLTPIEAAAFGKPTAALRFGGYLDTVLPGVSGTFFEVAEAQAIAASVGGLLHHTWDPARIVQHAASFSEARFAIRIQQVAEAAALMRSTWPEGVPSEMLG